MMFEGEYMVCDQQNCYFFFAY